MRSISARANPSSIDTKQVEKIPGDVPLAADRRVRVDHNESAGIRGVVQPGLLLEQVVGLPKAVVGDDERGKRTGRCCVLGKWTV